MRRSLGLTALLVALILARTIASSGGQVRSRYWRASAAPGRRLASGTHLGYCPAQPISLTPVDVLQTPIRTDDSYGDQLFGPPASGNSVFIAGEPSQGQTLVARTFTARDFPALRRERTQTLPPGRYTYLLRVSGATASRLTITLVARPGC